MLIILICKRVQIWYMSVLVIKHWTKDYEIMTTAVQHSTKKCLE